MISTRLDGSPLLYPLPPTPYTLSSSPLSSSVVRSALTHGKINFDQVLTLIRVQREFQRDASFVRLLTSFDFSRFFFFLKGFL